MEQLWLGYDGLTVRYAEIAAVLIYHPSLARRILTTSGRIPPNIRAIIVTEDGAFLPSSLTAEQLRLRVARWRTTQQAD